MTKEELVSKVGRDEAVQLVESAHALDSAEKELKKKTEAFKKDTKFLTEVIAENKAYLLKSAKENELDEIPANNISAEIKSRKSTVLHTDKLWGLVCKQKQANLFWKMVKGQIGKAKAIVGEKILKDAGVIEESIDNYNSVKIVKI